MVIENSAPIAHNAKWSSSNNGDVNPLLAAGGKFELPKPMLAESSVISLSCSIHPWMKAYVQVFDEEKALDKLEAFASENGPRFYGLPLNQGTITFERKDHRVPDSLETGPTTLVPFHAGETLAWCLTP